MRTAKSRAIIRHIIILSLLAVLGLAAPDYWQGTKADSGTTVAVSGDTILIGCPGRDIGANTDQGSALSTHGRELPGSSSTSSMSSPRNNENPGCARVLAGRRL